MALTPAPTTFRMAIIARGDYRGHRVPHTPQHARNHVQPTRSDRDAVNRRFGPSADRDTLVNTGNGANRAGRAFAPANPLEKKQLSVHFAGCA